jgi:UDP-3-O-[3-hydroxymyristoyl] glucosamine N-acyltransferase
VQLGSVSTVDKGLYGDFTVLGDYTQTDSHVYLAHNVVCGRRCTLTTGVAVPGWSTLGDDVWMGPSTSVNQLLHVGSGAFVGTGSTVRHDVPAHGLLYGSTARQKGWSCVCHTRLESGDEVAFSCPSCGRRYRREGERLSLAR